MRTKGTPAELEAERLRAAELLGRGKGTSEVARLVGVVSSAVSKWKRILRKRGPMVTPVLTISAANRLDIPCRW